MKIQKILITGPESTGKTKLCNELSDYFKTNSTVEFAREYLQQKNGEYIIEDLDIILKGQIEKEEICIKKSNTFLFCDTGPEVIKIWSEYKYSQISDYINHQFKNHKYSFTLLLYPDLDWEFDPLRELQDVNDRMNVFELYQKLFIENQIEFKIIKDKGNKRFLNALTFINAKFKLSLFLKP